MEEQKDIYKLDMVSIRLVHDAPVLSDHRILEPKDAIHVMGQLLYEMDREVLCVINLKQDGTPINGHVVSMGAINQTLASPREMLKTAILSNAANIILMHNHPSGSLEPSKEDVAITDQMINLCKLVEIPLLDHIIVGGDSQEYFSFREKCILKNPDIRLQTDYQELEFELPNVAEQSAKQQERLFRKGKSR